MIHSLFWEFWLIYCRSGTDIRYQDEEAAFSNTEPLQSTDVYLDPSKAKLNESCAEKLCARKLCAEDIEKYKDGSIYLTYPAGGNGKKEWIKELKTMDHGLKTDRNTIVEIVACKMMDRV